MEKLNIDSESTLNHFDSKVPNTSPMSEPLTNLELAQLKQNTKEKVELLQKIYPNLQVVSHT